MQDKSQAEDPSSPGWETDDDSSTTAESESPPRIWKRLWLRLELDLETVKMMAKGALPPAIAAAMNQSDSVAHIYTTLAYLVSIMAFFSFATQPRARFVQTMTLNIIGVCIAAAVMLLSIYCAVKSREHSGSGAQQNSSNTNVNVSYSASASAIIGVWLCVSIYLINVGRALRPQYSVTGTILSFFVIVASVNATRISQMSQGEMLIKHLIGAFLMGFAIAVGVSFFIFPRSHRKLCFKLTDDFVGKLKESLKAQGAYMRRMRRKNLVFTCVQETNVSTARMTPEEIRTTNSPEAQRLKLSTASLSATFGRMHTELHYAKSEFAVGHLDVYDLKKIRELLQSILLPMNGMSTLVDILKEVAIRAVGAEDDDGDPDGLAFDDLQAERIAWAEVMDSLVSSFESLAETLEIALDHVYIQLRFGRRRKRAEDAEKGRSRPDDADLAALLSRKLKEFDSARADTLRGWSQAANVDLPVAFMTDPARDPQPTLTGHFAGLRHHRKNQQRMYLVLYIEFLTWSTAKGVLDLVVFADTKSQEATKRGSRLILPGKRRMKKWIRNMWISEDSIADPTITGREGTRTIVHLGEAYRKRKDPEHLPAASYLEVIGDHIRSTSHFFASEESAFGFRAVCAVMTVAIIAFLRDTQTWFLQQRGLWALILVAISLAPTTGASVIGFLGRVVGTIAACCTSITLWYIADGKAGGVIPVLFIVEFLGFYTIFKYPQFSVGAILFNVTNLLIVGYELEVTKLGKETVASNGQPYYPIYLLAPYRLATVLTGTFVAFIWSYFPFPVTTHGKLRRDLGAGLYLLATYYATVHSTVEMRLRDDVLDPRIKKSPAYRVEKARNKAFAKTGIQISKLQVLAREWEPTIGGRFPKETYHDIIASMQIIFNYITLISYSTRTFSPSSPLYSASALPSTDRLSPTLSNESQTLPGTEQPWIHNFRLFMRGLHITTYDITSVLSLLSASVTNAQPLPPLLRVPHPYTLGPDLHIIDPDVLRIEHVAEPCYAAFAVCQVASSLISEELERMIGLVKSLVGEVDFSFHIEQKPERVTTWRSRTNTFGTKNAKEDAREKKKKRHGVLGLHGKGKAE
ncbi:hypothetical protein AYO21_07275 [Fonsecaea monophora]|uniref:Uncharacterized protein n=1 Tax=Fonsecaea monophora TaxID=254056 RepID=A0A177F2D5_9EURO|nr:hypothetical protein AYO21_07275 [Fonsecaea monophora]OAG38453.1 hypothetical protein AYO21_07275 [Fonsecaea monophora]